MKADWSTVICSKLYYLKMVCPRAHVDVQILPWSILGASSVHPRCLPGASSVPPRCLVGASSVHPRTHWLGPTTCFGPVKLPRIFIPSQLDPNFVAFGTNLVQVRTNLSQIGAIFVQLRSHFVLTWAILTQIATKGISKIIVFPLVFQCFWHVGLHTNYVTTCDNLNPTWTRFRMSWGQFRDNLN